MKELILVKEYQKFITASVSGRRLTSSGKKITEGRIFNYVYTKKLLEEYEVSYHQILRVVIINKASLITLQKEKNYWMKFYRQFSNFLYKEKGFHDIYVLNTYKNIKVFFNYLNIEKAMPVGQFHKLFKTPNIQFAPVVFSPEQLNFLITNKTFSEMLSPNLRKVKDICIIGCTFGLRISDLMRLKKTNMVCSKNETYIKILTQKTSTEVKIPIPEYVLEILNKYKNESSRFLLPQLNSANINISLKVLAEKAGWTYNLPKYMSRQGKIAEVMNKKGKCYRFCDHITAHTMRRTAITTLLILGVPELVVRRLSGHAPGSKEFYRYISIANDYSNQKIKEAQNKLLNLKIDDLNDINSSLL